MSVNQIHENRPNSAEKNKQRTAEKTAENKSLKYIDTYFYKFGLYLEGNGLSSERLNGELT